MIAGGIPQTPSLQFSNRQTYMTQTRHSPTYYTKQAKTHTIRKDSQHRETPTLPHTQQNSTQKHYKQNTPQDPSIPE